MAKGSRTRNHHLRVGQYVVDQTTGLPAEVTAALAHDFYKVRYADGSHETVDGKNLLPVRKNCGVARGANSSRKTTKSAREGWRIAEHLPIEAWDTSVVGWKETKRMARAVQSGMGRPPADPYALRDLEAIPYKAGFPRAWQKAEARKRLAQTRSLPAPRLPNAPSQVDHGDAGSVISLPFPGGSRTSLPGPRGGLVYVRWDTGVVEGVFRPDLVSESTGRPVKSVREGQRVVFQPTWAAMALYRNPSRKSTKAKREEWRKSSAREGWSYTAAGKAGRPWAEGMSPVGQKKVARRDAREFGPYGVGVDRLSHRDAGTYAAGWGGHDAWSAQTAIASARARYMRDTHPAPRLPNAASARDFALGAIERRDVDDENRLHLFKEHGVYHVRGFVRGRHVAEAFRTLRQARSYMRKLLPHTGRRA